MLVGNWKMHGLKAQLSEVQAVDEAAKGLEVVLCLPATLIMSAAACVRNVEIGAQDCHAAQSGAYTGQLSAPMLSDAGARWVIIGHSECRATGLGAVEIAAKLAASAPHLNAILCVGETDPGDEPDAVVAELMSSIPADTDPSRLTVAYEPVWAIGTGLTPAPGEIDLVHERLRSTLIERFGPAGATIRILYGGSANSENAGSILRQRHVNGLLVGGASLSAHRFLPIMLEMARVVAERR